MKIVEAGRSVRLGKGVIGKTGHVALGVLLVWAVLLWRWSESIILDAGLLLCGLIATSFGAWWVIASQRFARENPAQAMLDGAEFLEYKKMEASSKETKSLTGPNTEVVQGILK